MQIHKYSPLPEPQQNQCWGARRVANRGAELAGEVRGWFRLLVKVCLYSFRLEPPWVELHTCGTGRHLCFRNGLQLREYFEGRKEGCFVLLEAMPIGHVLLKCIYHLMLYVIWQSATGAHLSTAVVAERYEGQEIWTGIFSETLFKRTVALGMHIHFYHIQMLSASKKQVFHNLEV